VIYNTVGKLASYEKINMNSKLTILTLGHVAAYKNPYFWIEVAKKVIQELPEQAQFIWSGEGELLCDCLKRMEVLNIPDIKFIGFVDDVNTLYAESDIYFQPSLIESLSLSVLDAMRWGLPCLVSVNGGLPETVINNETGFVVDVNSVERTSQKIVQLILDSKLRNEMGKAARLYYENKFSQDKWFKAMETIHLEILI
jgi:glycosyltransferase involved in cell wall biosynthesis